MYMAMSSLAYIPGVGVKFFFQLIYTDNANWAYFDKRSHLNLLLWNCSTKFGGNGPFKNCVQQSHPPFKMADITKNRNSPGTLVVDKKKGGIPCMASIN